MTGFGNNFQAIFAIQDIPNAYAANKVDNDVIPNKIIVCEYDPKKFHGIVTLYARCFHKFDKLYKANAPKVIVPVNWTVRLRWRGKEKFR